MRLFVLGHRGMLGHAVVRYLRERGEEVVTSDHRYAGRPSDPLIAEVVASAPDVVVNCAGITTHRKVVEESLFAANAVLPQHLAAVLGPGQMLVHPSTDCVFDGRRGNYAVTDAPDALDPYGLSKRLGELALGRPGPDVVVLRTSIIGPEDGTARGLMAWFLSQSAPVSGWVDHRWNGITTLAWAALCHEVASRNGPLGAGLHQPTTERVVSKFELLGRLAAVFDHPITIEPTESGTPVDRTLRPSHPMPPLDDQLVALREWWSGRAP
jgi:dTDP-4-dehydrorhamnose reductase